MILHTWSKRSGPPAVPMSLWTKTTAHFTGREPTALSITCLPRCDDVCVGAVRVRWRRSVGMAEQQQQPPPQQQQQQQFDSKEWPVVYPAYIDAAKTIALVRRWALGVPPRTAAARCLAAWLPAACCLLPAAPCCSLLLLLPAAALPARALLLVVARHSGGLTRASCVGAGPQGVQAGRRTVQDAGDDAGDDPERP
eukprot:COSAG02_NODE_20091_length_849_cov_0.737333_1_plen_195_part_01